MSYAKVKSIEPNSRRREYTLSYVKKEIKLAIPISPHPLPLSLSDWIATAEKVREGTPARWGWGSAEEMPLICIAWNNLVIFLRFLVEKGNVEQKLLHFLLSFKSKWTNKSEETKRRDKRSYNSPLLLWFTVRGCTREHYTTIWTFQHQRQVRGRKRETDLKIIRSSILF